MQRGANWWCDAGRASGSQAALPWQPERICTRLSGPPARAFTRRRLSVVSIQACVRVHEGGRCTRARSCTCTRAASHSQFLLQALFLASGTYIIRVTPGGNKRREGENISVSFTLCLPLLFSSPSAAFARSSLHLSSHLFSASSRLSLHLRSSQRITFVFPHHDARLTGNRIGLNNNIKIL